MDQRLQGPQSALDPASPEAAGIVRLWWVFLSVCSGVYVVVVGALLVALGRAWRLRRSQPAVLPAPEFPAARAQRRVEIIVGSAVGVTIVILLGFLLLEFITHRTYASPDAPDAPDPPGPAPLVIRITGHQWWWKIEYEDPQPSKRMQTANELHLPVGRPIRLLLNSADVIHSLWLPYFQGKKDLIPGHATSLAFTPNRIGEFRGQCAEFCGHQHAFMRLLVVVEEPEESERWLARQRQPAREPATATQRRGRDVFLSSSCLLCHTIAGTPAGSRAGPSLTHFASRRMLGAGAAPNTRAHLAGWILDPHSLKPGVHMPANALSSEDLSALLDYLQSLQ